MAPVATPATEPPHSLESAIKGEVLRMYHEVAEHPENTFHFYHGRSAAEMFAYDRAWLDRAPPGAVASFAGVGNPHQRSRLREGDVVVDVGSGAGLDSIIAGWQVGQRGRVIGVDVNPEMLKRAAEHAREAGLEEAAFRKGRMEELPVEDQSASAVISNGVINLSFQKRRVFQELFRVLRPGGRISVTDIVSARQLKQSIVNDPKLWAS
jgi:SAM-dependent methyltransferase